MANEGRIIGLAMITGSRVLLPGEVSSIDGNVTLPSVATIGTIQFANISISTIEVGTVAVVVDTSTIGTVLSGNVSSSVISPLDGGRVAVNVGTIESAPLVTEGRYFVQTNVLGVGFTGSYSGLTVATLSAGALQDLVVDVVYGTVVVGSVQTQVLGVEPQSGIATSTITATAWYAGTLVAGQRLTASGPVGALIAVSVNAVGTVAGIYVTAEQSAGG
jgi:hypothetical protein